MSLQKITIILLMFSILFLASCTKDESSPTEAENSSENSNMSGQPIPSFGNNSAGVMATINYEMQTVPGFPSASIQMAFAQFGTGADAGSISVNNNSLGKTTQSGTTFYLVPSPSDPTQQISGIEFNGSNHNWQVSGSGNVPQLSGSVSSPSNFSVSSPTNNATISKSSDLNVNWNNTSANSRILVVLAAINNSNQYYAAEDLNDSGSFTISSSDLSGFSGDTMLQVVKYNYSNVSSGGNDYYIIAEIVKNITIKIN